MSEDFDPYYKWLAIPPEEQPPDHYRLLGIPRFTADADVIENAADQRMSHLRSVLAGNRAALAQKVLNELAIAKLCLLNHAKKVQYDSVMQSRLPRSVGASSVELPLPNAILPPNKDHDIQPIISSNSSARNSRQNSKPAIINIVGHVLAPIAGLVFGYLLICQISPRNDFLHLFQKPVVPQAKQTATNEAAPPLVLVDNESNIPIPVESVSSQPRQETPMVQPKEPDAKSTGTQGHAQPVPMQQPQLGTGEPGAEAIPKAPSASVAPQIVLEKERDDALERGDLTLALAKTTAIAAHTGGNVLDMKLAVIVKLRDRDNSQDDFRQLTEEMLSILREAANDGRTELIRINQDQLLLWARKSTNTSLERQVTQFILNPKTSPLGK